MAEDGPTVAPDEGASDEPSEEATTAPATSTEPTAEDPSVEPAAPDAPFVLDRQRAVSGRTKDWVVRWSSDGRAFAVWTGEPGSVGRGSLIVRSAPTAAAPSGDILVDRVRAGRSFGLGLERIAWVAPLDDGEGELWLSVWGDGGEGAVKLRRLEFAGDHPGLLSARAAILSGDLIGRPREPGEEGGGRVSARQIMTADEVRRALVRISHEIVEKHGGTTDLALVGIQRRGVPLAERLAATIAEHEGVAVPGRRARHHLLPRRPARRGAAAASSRAPTCRSTSRRRRS